VKSPLAYSESEKLIVGGLKTRAPQDWQAGPVRTGVTEEVLSQSLQDMETTARMKQLEPSTSGAKHHRCSLELYQIERLGPQPRIVMEDSVVTMPLMMPRMSSALACQKSRPTASSHRLQLAFCHPGRARPK